MLWFSDSVSTSVNTAKVFVLANMGTWTHVACTYNSTHLCVAYNGTITNCNTGTLVKSGNEHTEF
jgi:hypothetical protein